MTYSDTDHTTLMDVAPSRNDFLQDVVEALSGDHKHLPSKYFYDQRGSELFDEICEQQEYYVTRTELQIMRDHVAEMARQIGPEVMLVEYGSGSGKKTRLLLDSLLDPVAYVPVDISRQHLSEMADQLALRYPQIEVLPVCADFTRPFQLPRSQRPASHAAVYFPGSTIGNFSRTKARQLLQQIQGLCGTGGGLLIGIDLRKSEDVLVAAYDDSGGVTADFNRNLLVRINRELGADFQPDQFEHEARFNSRESRIEMHLVSLRTQTVTVAGHEFGFREGESVCTEHSHKYTLDSFCEIAAEAGLMLHKAWTDPRDFFAVLHLVVES